MFTGIITDVGEIVAIEERGELRRLRIACAYDFESIATGASIACSGACLTVVAKAANGRTEFEIDAAAETLARTTVAQWRVGDRINLERALKIGDELGGHIVTGHVDGIAQIVSREKFDGMARFAIEAPEALARFIAPKGSVTLDGVSLTVNEVDDSTFGVNIIPHTAAHTTLGALKPGDAVNMEIDMLARYVARLIAQS